ncbi:hypothetical protein CTAM01_07903 [Colletotrichum tamarilloi]|uniref:Uncharacterized protein n=1 Tax=Colletotrichum tamarilloi TaxID=1209934 RepID=A0ABQ9R7J2_9PEZI|nr:uncharacterized protein CTAM01_07903 [Colletotrichum tamarilloi]KAI3546779.1 hypothetical protein CSPX01_04021 [Colletotrichum filicis]KAK1497239.1 hypothetical protein CTAM01_07903 [Colletotrichum tamarilloi]
MNDTEHMPMFHIHHSTSQYTPEMPVMLFSTTSKRLKHLTDSSIQEASSPTPSPQSSIHHRPPRDLGVFTTGRLSLPADTSAGEVSPKCPSRHHTAAGRPFRPNAAPHRRPSPQPSTPGTNTTNLPPDSTHTHTHHLSPTPPTNFDK